MNQKIKAGIVGATGYTGVELLRLLSTHPNVEVTAITSRSEAGIAIADYFPSLRGIYDLTFQTPDQARLDQCDVVFFATPNGVAMKEAPALLNQNVRIVDYPPTSASKTSRHGNNGTACATPAPILSRKPYTD